MNSAYVLRFAYRTNTGMLVCNRRRENDLTSKHSEREWEHETTNANRTDNRIASQHTNRTLEEKQRGSAQCTVWRCSHTEWNGSSELMCVYYTVSCPTTQRFPTIFRFVCHTNTNFTIQQRASVKPVESRRQQELFWSKKSELNSRNCLNLCKVKVLISIRSIT